MTRTNLEDKTTATTAAAAAAAAAPAMAMRRSEAGTTNPSYVHSRVTVYHASKIDLRYCRSMHSCQSCQLGHLELPCGAVHYGMCRAVILPTTTAATNVTAGRYRRGPVPPTLPMSPHAHTSSTSSSSAPSSPSSPSSPSAKFVSVMNRPVNPKKVRLGLGGMVKPDLPRSPSSPVEPESSPRSRSLAILREGHELAGTLTPAAVAAEGAGPGLQQRSVSPPTRQHPQRQVVLQGQNIRIGAGGGVVGPGVGSGAALAVTPRDMATIPSESQGGGGGGVAITIQHGQTNITSGGNTDIKIQGQGHEIHIKGSGGGQNIRVHPASGGGGYPGGHVIRIHGRGDPQAGPAHLRGGAGSQQSVVYDTRAMIPRPAVFPQLDGMDSPTSPTPSPLSPTAAQSILPLQPHGYISSRHIATPKPTARVAPAPVLVQAAPVSVPVPVPDPTLNPSPSPTPGSSPPSTAPLTPPFPVSSANTPTASPPLSPTPLVDALSSGSINQPVLTVNNKDKEISNHVGPATTTTSPNAVSSGGDIRAQQHQPQQLRGAKDVSSDGNGDGLLSHEPGSGKRRLQTSERDLLAPGQKPNQRPLPGPREPTAEKGNKENRPKKRGGLPRSASDVHIPAFYFPRGRPGQGPDLDTTLHRLSQEFSALDGGKAYKQQMPAVTKACGLPLYWKILLFRAAGGSSEGYVTFHGLSALLKKLHQNYHDDASKFMRLTTKPGATVLEFEDFEPLMQDVVETHPGLTFLQDAPEFHSRYVTTVISRVMYCVNRSWSGCISLPELRCANFLQTLHKLESEEDINQVKEFFSYEHFYVIYCKFWELDKDHDLYIDKNDLSRHNDHALNSRLIDRIFSGAVTRGEDFQGGRMSYREFVWFLLAEEDKKHPTSIEYWFRCMDLDGDGVISMYEMEYFHEEQMNKMEALGIERLPFEDTVCQMMDMVCPRREGKITLGDLKACQMTSIFFDTFFNLDKFLEHEQRDPFANARDPNAEIVAVSDWERYAEEEYDILVADEGNADLEDGHYEDDFEPEDDDEILREEMLRLADKGPPQRNMTGQSHTAEDIYDFSGTTNLGY